MLKVASLFCGCGGSDLGLLGGFTYLGHHYPQLAFDIVYAVDFDKYAVDTYNRNFAHPAVCADVSDVDFTTLPDVDVLIGGFPCQSFSTVNPTKDTNDERANLYKQIVRFLQIKHPKYFICENVKGLLTLQKGAIISKIVSEFEKVGYNVHYRLMKAVEFGIPQRRERVFIVGIRKDLSDTFSYPTPINSIESCVPLSAVIERLDIPDQKYYFSERAVQGMKNAKNNMKRGLWQDLNGPCLTITSHLAKTSINSRDPLLLVDPNRELYRRFTPREAARIQSFPENFILNPSEPKSYKQIGNAIPPVLMWHIARSLQNLAENNDEDLPVTSEATEYFVSQIHKHGYYNYESNPFAGTLFNEPSLPYGNHHTY
ncbi:MAG: DNA (cytosine-5-)-methyltransferase [Bacteroides sp.]|nr:DNA (cytosine-5-)-methyltransferase [Bacteroides sp.]MCM1379022.1 DNA (cytosine-5-)-methyltransferase [Bacteroides sp.]MCM1445638.1 DNA (cytosine-5-)-methyltransferase [Prevotella sp.]